MFGGMGAPGRGHRAGPARLIPELWDVKVYGRGATSRPGRGQAGFRARITMEWAPNPPAVLRVDSLVLAAK